MLHVWSATQVFSPNHHEILKVFDRDFSTSPHSCDQENLSICLPLALRLLFRGNSYSRTDAVLGSGYLRVEEERELCNFLLLQAFSSRTFDNSQGIMRALLPFFSLKPFCQNRLPRSDISTRYDSPGPLAPPPYRTAVVRIRSYC